MRLVQSPLPADNNMFHNGKHSIYKYTIYIDPENTSDNTSVVYATQNWAGVINEPNHYDSYPNYACESLYFEVHKVQRYQFIYKMMYYQHQSINYENVYCSLNWFDAWPCWVHV